jgi:hypothetical protein
MTTYFGRDISCTNTLKTGRYSFGVMLVAEACYRRLTTPRGTLRGGENELNYGLDLTSLVGSATTRAAAAALPGQIENELRKDERVESASASVVATTVGPVTTWTISVDVLTAEGPFTLQIESDGVTAALLGIT